MAKSYLSSFDWQNVLLDVSLDESCERFYGALRSALSYIPCDLIIRRQSDKPWITNVIKVLINKRYKAYHEKNWDLYYHYQSKVKSAIFDAKKHWGDAVLNSSSHSIWDVYKLMGCAVVSDNKRNHNSRSTM